MKKKKTYKRKLEDFVRDESGFISKDKILKIGLGTISAMGILSAFSSNLLGGHTNHTSHSSALTILPAPGGCGKIAHGSTCTHSSHGQY